MAEQRLVVPKEAGTENEGRDPLIVQVRTTGDCLTNNGASYINLQSQEEIHQCWDFHLQKFLKSVAVLPTALPPLEENATDSQASMERDKENPEQEVSGWSRGESVLQRDPNISAKAWTGREKLDFCMKVKVKETLKEVDLGSQWPLQLRQLGPQDAEQHQEVSNHQRLKKEGKVGQRGVPKDTVLKPPKLEEEAFEIRRVKIPLDIKQEIDGEANSPDPF
ncbi:hypothetical protein E2320_014490 [Naja naja]|nr:hypothetical protein E2320_014490 [Naja naja]